LADHAVLARAEADNDVAQHAIADIQNTAPRDAVAIDQGFVVVDLVVDHRCEQVVRGGDRVHVACEVKVQPIHRHDLAVATSRGAALDAEGRSHRRLTDGDSCALADERQRLAQADSCCRLPLAQRRRCDRRHDNVLRLRL